MVAAVKKYGGWVHYDWEFVNGKLAKNLQPPGPMCLRKLLNEECFQEVVYVNLVRTDPTGKQLDVTQSSAADSILSRLDGMPKLKVLILMGKQVTDQGMKHLHHLPSLERLLIWDAGAISDAGVADLDSLGNLVDLHISQSQLTDKSLATLARLPKLEILSLPGNRFTDAGLALLKKTSTLKRLYIKDNTVKFTDAGLVNLRKVESLELIDLGSADVTDAGLEQLKGLHEAQRIVGRRTWVTDEGKVKFKATMPNVTLVR